MPEPSAMLAEISNWIDEYPANKRRTKDEAFLLRAIKVYEETGELAKNIIGMTGQNPRKGVTSSLEEVLDETMDGALTLLMFAESATGNQGLALGMLGKKLAAVYKRMLADPSFAETVVPPQ